jgi:3-oxoacyl-[acyl-carrier-protein] synthase II
MSERRVVITGIGIVSPLANGREATWERLIAGQSGAGKIDVFDASDMPCKIAFQVPYVSGRGGGAGDAHAFDPDKVLSAKEQRRIDEFILYAIAAADEAVEDSGWKPESEDEKERTGVMIGSGIGGLESIYQTAITLHEQGPRKVSPFFIPASLINLASGQVSIRHGLKGPNHSVVTAAPPGLTPSAIPPASLSTATRM